MEHKISQDSYERWICSCGKVFLGHGSAIHHVQRREYWDRPENKGKESDKTTKIKEYLQEHPKLKRMEVAHIFGVSSSYISQVFGSMQET